MCSDLLSVTQVVADLGSVGMQLPRRLSPPEGGGLYAWWARLERLGDATPAVPSVVHPTAASRSLLYVGIVPRKGSTATKRDFMSRVIKDHRSGSIGNSSFRQSLGSLLMRYLNLQPKTGFDRSRFVDERRLTRWIEENCSVTFASVERPWLVEEAVIDRMFPPLNIRPGSHEFRHTVESAREALRRACGL